MDMRIETIKAHPQYGSYLTGTPTRYTVVVRVSVVRADDVAEAAGMVAAAINGYEGVAKMEAERDAARAERDSLAQLMTTPLRIKGDNGEARL